MGFAVPGCALCRACLQKLSREDRFKVISEEFSQRQRLLFEKWMELPEVQNVQSQSACRPRKRRKVGVFHGSPVHFYDSVGL